MKKIAIFTSGTGELTSGLVSLFNKGDRVRIDLVITDRGDTRLVEQMIQKGVNAMFLPRELWRINPGNILNLLDENKIEFIALDELNGFLPEEVSERYAGRIVNLSSPDEATREVETALKLEENPVEVAVDEKPIGENVAETQEEVIVKEEEKSVDEDWAETLKVKFDPEQVAQTPPPIPGVTASSHPSQPNQNQNQIQQQPYQQFRQAQQQQFQQQPFNQQAQQNAYAQQNQEPMPSTYLVWSILCTIFCCFIPGIVAIIFSSQVSSKYYMGDIEGAKKASRNAEVWIIVSFVFGILTSTLYLPIMLMSA